MLVFGGLFKEAHKMYLNKELEVYKEKDEIKYVYMLYYNWAKKEYENTKLRESSSNFFYKMTSFAYKMTSFTNVILLLLFL